MISTQQNEDLDLRDARALFNARKSKEIDKKFCDIEELLINSKNNGQCFSDLNEIAQKVRNWTD